MKKLSKIILLSVTCCSLFAIGQTLGQEASSSDSLKNQTIILKSSKYNEVQWEQENYIRKHYEDYRKVSVTYSLPTDEDDRYLETYALVKDKDDRVDVVFDLTNAYKARNRKGNEALKKIIKDLESEKEDRKANRLTKEESNEVSKTVAKILKEDIDKLVNEKETLTETERKIIEEKIEALINKLKKEKLEARKKSSQ